MTFRCFNTTLLCCILFFDIFVHFASAEVVQAYRTPSEADLEWLLGDTSTFIPSVASPSVIVQTGYVSPKRTTASVEPCRPVGLPNPPIPPAPESAARKMNTGLAVDEEGVVSITTTVADSTVPVMQMSGDRIPPPAEVPREKEPSVAAPLLAPAVEHQTAPESTEHLLDLPDCSDEDIGCGSGSYCSGKSGYGNLAPGNSPCFCLACIACGNHCNSQRHTCGNGSTMDNEQWITQLDTAYQHCRAVCLVPDMIGSGAWFTGQDVGITRYNTNSVMQITFPTMLLTRPNVVEHFNASVQNRIWADHRHWHNATSVYIYSQMFTFGLEKQLSRDCSMELRMPVIGHVGSSSVAVASAELGNASLFLKQIFLQGSRMTISGGVGASLPTADDWQPLATNARLKNNVHYLVTFLGAQWHPNNNMFGHCVVQTDVPIKKHELILDGQPSADVSGQHVIRTGVQLGRWVYRYNHGKRPCHFGAFAEVNYAVVTSGSAGQSLLSPNGVNPAYSIYVSEFASQKSTLTAALGMPMVFGRLTCTSAVILPISGNDRPFSVGYNFSLSRQF